VEKLRPMPLVRNEALMRLFRLRKSAGLRRDNHTKTDSEHPERKELILDFAEKAT
jgi:hypothetical protein